jgi:hypothetical protein
MSDRNDPADPNLPGQGTPPTTRDRGGGCPFHDAGAERKSTGEGPTDAEEPTLAGRAVNRRSFLRTALAIGGTSALAAVSGRAVAGASAPRSVDLDVPRGPTDPNAFPERQHAWKRDVKKDPFGNVVLPNHQLILFLDYAREGTPTGRQRREVESAFRTLELAFQRLSGGDPDGDNQGLVFMVGYSRSYFDRFGSRLCSSVDLLRPEEVLRRTDDDPGKADHYDAVVLLSSASVPVLLASEAALFGGLDTLNGVDVRGTLVGTFETAE